MVRATNTSAAIYSMYSLIFLVSCWVASVDEWKSEASMVVTIIVVILFLPATHLTYKRKWKHTQQADLLWVLPKVVAGGCQKYTVSLDGSTLHQQHHIKQDATLSESQQALQQAAGMGWTSVGLSARAAWGASSSYLSILSHGTTLMFRLHYSYLSSTNIIRRISYIVFKRLM